MRLAPLLLTPFVLGCGHKVIKAPGATESANEAFLEMTDEYARILLARSPLRATSLGVSEQFVGSKFSDKLGDFSVDSIAKKKAFNAELRERLATFDRNQLSETARTTYDVLKSSANMAHRTRDYNHGGFESLNVFSPFPVSQLLGPHIDIPRSLQTEHPLKSEQDVSDYLSRLGAMHEALSGVADIVRYDAKKKVLPPRFAVEGALKVIEKFTAFPAAEHPLVTNLKSKLAQVTNMKESARSAYVANAEQLIESSVYPGYQKLVSALREILPSTSERAGIWGLPNGEQRYRLALQSFGAGGKSAEEIHNLGLAEVARIQKEMDGILRGQGYEKGSVTDRYMALAKEKRFLYPNSREGKKELLAALNNQMDEVTARLPEILLTIPKAAVEVRAIPEHEQDSSSGGYYTGPTIDGSRAGIYWINLKDTAEWPKFSLATLTYHEASPGHHLQNAIALETRNMPMIRNLIWISQYGEGWALYAELLAKEIGLYKDDPFGDIGRLQSELFRAARLVVDTGIHHKRWTREQAIDYLQKATGDNEAAVTREIERYSVWPGQACAYKLGQLRILELREMAKKKLGPRFDLREFNDQILIKGEVPLDVLAANIEEWSTARDLNRGQRAQRPLTGN